MSPFNVFLRSGGRPPEVRRSETRRWEGSRREARLWSAHGSKKGLGLRLGSERRGREEVAELSRVKGRVGPGPGCPHNNIYSPFIDSKS